MMIAPPPKNILDVPGFNNVKHLTNLDEFESGSGFWRMVKNG